ncbi:Uu.00g060430.m01.CDS01 [Anthostomella pinea]|uniref:Uu.00g060430.m01.CDS01 n=1 Tax=Anthostomella pinea TaxID=933095 RepID=A0AAI8YMB8_9PEZI|nr:Uu.00g060430.m01.CDS01 [Anthostomella pinea]
MASLATSMTGSSYDEHSAAFSDVTHAASESPVPELDNDVSTDDRTSDYLSTRTTSLFGPVLEPEDDFGPMPLDAVSMYSPSHYPAVSTTYRTERPFDAERGTVNSTRSITDTDVDYVMENGRRYCGSYLMPNDEDEQVRLQLVNQVYLKAFDGELTSVPLECPTHILDIGTAVGEWAIDMAEAFPECEVTGTDISNIFERRAPQNVYWEVDDAELDWERPPNHYDLVHLRNMAGSFADWEFIYRSAFTCLKPGGWIELLDFDENKGMRGFFSFFEPGSLIHKVDQDLQEAAILSGRPYGISHLEPRFLVNAGYVDVQLTEHAIPLRTEDGSTGKFWLLAMLNGMEPLCMRLLTKYKGWKADEVRLACDMIGQEMMAVALNPRKAKGFVYKVRVLIGRKPGLHPRWSTEAISESGEVMKSRPDEATPGDVPAGDRESGYGSLGRNHFASNHGSDLVVDSETMSDVATGQNETEGTASTVALGSQFGAPVQLSEDRLRDLDQINESNTRNELANPTVEDVMMEEDRQEDVPKTREAAQTLIPDTHMTPAENLTHAPANPKWADAAAQTTRTDHHSRFRRSIAEPPKPGAYNAAIPQSRARTTSI